MPGPGSFDPIRDGYATLITLSALPAAKLYEREVTPPQLDGGGSIESASMRNTNWRVKDPKTLVGIGDLVATVMYASVSYSQISALINSPQTITLRWPDGATLQFYGYVDKFAPGGHSEGNLPTATITIVVTLRHPTTGAETSPIFTPAA